MDYELTAIADTIPSFGDAVYFGNGQLAGLTGGDPNCPFFYGYITSMGAGGVVTLTDGTHTIVVNGSKLVGHKFNPDYVPVQNVNGETQVWNERTFVGTIGSIKAQGGVSFGFNSTAFGQGLAGGENSFAEGSGYASGDYSHAEGSLTGATMYFAHAEGVETTANGSASHAEGTFSIANGASSHAEGQQTNAWGAGSHAEGWQTQALGAYSHAEGGIYSPDGGSGTQTYASGDYSHAEGRGTEASGEASHSEGLGTIAHGTYQHASGKFNIQDNNNTYAEIIGNGTATNARSNARTLDWSGNEWVAGSMTAAGGFVGNVTGTASGNLPSSTTYAASNAVGGSATFANGIHYGRVDNTSTSTVYTATIPGITEYYDGLTIILYNGKVTSASGYTININGLGAYGTYSNMAVGNENTPTAPTRDTTIFNINYAMIFIYCSDIGGQGVTGWICYRGYDANTNTIGYQLRTNSSTMPASDKFYRYRILFTSADGHKWVPSTTSTSTNATAARAVNQRPIDPFGEIVYYGTTTAIEANANVTAAQLWQQYTMTLGYAFNRTGAALVLPYPSPIYIKCAPQSDGSAIIDADNPYVFTLPSTEDGKIYIYLGRTYSATAIEMTMNHPVYYYKDGAIREWTNAAASGGGGAVDSVNGKTGVVVLDAEDVGALPDDTVIPTVPTTVSSFTNDAGYLTSATGVTSVNGSSGAVTLAIPTKTSDLTNDIGFVDSTGAANAAPVQSVNGQTGAVSISVPTKTSDLTNDSGFITSAPVSSVNTKTGAVVLSASDVGALPSNTPIPSKTSDLSNDSNFITAAQAPVQSVNGQTGTVVLDADDVGALPDTTAIPTKTSDLTNDSGFITGMEILSYGSSTWADFLAAYNAKKVVYCRASSNTTPASGSQTRLAFMAYVNNAESPTNVEFQYYRSVSSKSASQQGDQVFVYTLTSSGWSVITREASTKIVAGTNMTQSYSNGTLTLQAVQPTVPTTVSSFTNDAGYLTLATLPIYNGGVS